MSEGERNAQFAGQLLVSLTGHLGTKTDLSGFRVYQDLAVHFWASPICSGSERLPDSRKILIVQRHGTHT